MNFDISVFDRQKSEILGTFDQFWAADNNPTTNNQAQRHNQSGDDFSDGGSGFNPFGAPPANPFGSDIDFNNPFDKESPDFFGGGSQNNNSHLKDRKQSSNSIPDFFGTNTNNYSNNNRVNTDMESTRKDLELFGLGTNTNPVNNGNPAQGDKQLSLGDFGDPEDNSNVNQSGISQHFNVPKSENNQDAWEREDVRGSVNQSRNLDDISFDGLGGNPRAFVFQKSMQSMRQELNESYMRLKQEVSKPKPKDFKEFFKELSDEGKKQGGNDSFLNNSRYHSKEEFEAYIINLKLEKRKRQQQHQKQANLQKKDSAIDFWNADDNGGSWKDFGKKASVLSNEFNWQEQRPLSKLEIHGARSSQNSIEPQKSGGGQQQQVKQQTSIGNWNSNQINPFAHKVSDKEFGLGDFQSVTSGFTKAKSLNQDDVSSPPANKAVSANDLGVGNVLVKPSSFQLDDDEDDWERKADEKQKRMDVVQNIPSKLQRPPSLNNTVARTVPQVLQLGSTGKIIQGDMPSQQGGSFFKNSPPVVEQTGKQQFLKPADVVPLTQVSKGMKQVPSPEMRKLATIRQENSNIFQKTIEQERMAKVVKNYQKLQQNYESLMNQLRSSSQGQQKILNELVTLRTECKTKDQTVQKTIQIKEQIKQRKNQNNLIELRKISEEQSIRANVEKEIRQKILRMQEFVKTSFDTLNTVPEPPNLVWVNPSLPKEPPKKTYEAEKDNYSQRASQSQRSHENQQSRQSDNDRPGPNNKKAKPKQLKSIETQIYSPLQLRLQNFPESPFVMLQQSRSFEKNTNYFRESLKRASLANSIRRYSSGEAYTPKHIAQSDQFLRSACLQQQCTIFESFDFLVHAKYSLSSVNAITKRRCCKINVTLRNKTILNLNDVIFVVYGSSGQQLSISPAKIWAQVLKPQETLAFDIYLQGINPGNHHLNMQACYKTETLARKKVEIRIPRPVTKFFDLQFTHQQQFSTIWAQIPNQLFVEAKLLNFKLIKSSQDIKMMLPFIEISEQLETEFGYGLLFNLLNVDGLFLLKLLCSTDGKASIHLKYQSKQLRPYAEQILDIMNCIFYL